VLERLLGAVRCGAGAGDAGEATDPQSQVPARSLVLA